LHHRGPDVVEELNLDDRLEAAGGHAGSAPNNGSLGERSIKDSIIAELALQAERQLKDSAFAFDQLAL